MSASTKTSTTHESDMMDDVMIAEGVVEVSRDEYLAAWQRLVDSGVVWSLQGYFGRTASVLIANGLIRANPQEHLRHHVTGAIERGEKTAIEEKKT